MVVKIRLARFGKRHAPFYNIVVSQARTARNSKPMEVIGTYDPTPKTPIGGEGRKYKDIQLDSARAKYWLGVGAQPSEPAWRLLAMAGLVEPKFKVDRRGQIDPEIWGLARVPAVTEELVEEESEQTQEEQKEEAKE